MRITITIHKSDNEQWLAEASVMGLVIQTFGYSKKYTLDAVKVKILEQLAHWLESSSIKLNSVRFKVRDLSVEGKLFKLLREKISSGWNSFTVWTREKPYLEYFLETSISIWAICILLVFILLAILVYILVLQLLQDNQTYATILAASIGFGGVLLSVLIQAWINVNKNQIDRYKDGISKMSDYYERLIKIIKTPGCFPLDEVSEFIDEFDNKVEIYGSRNLVYQWKRFKGRILSAQAEPSKTGSLDWHSFRNFIGAIRIEMGRSSSSEIRHYIYNDLKSKYENKRDYSGNR